MQYRMVGLSVVGRLANKINYCTILMRRYIPYRMYMYVRLAGHDVQTTDRRTTTYDDIQHNMTDDHDGQEMMIVSMVLRSIK